MSGFLPRYPAEGVGTDVLPQGEPADSAGLYSSIEKVIKSDAVYCALVQNQPEHAERRALELVEKLQEEDAGRQVAVLQSRIRKQELESAQLRQEVASLQAKCRQAEESAVTTHAESSAHAEKAKVHASEARALRNELESVSQRLNASQSDAAVCENRNAQLTRQLAESRSAEQARARDLTQQRNDLETTVVQLNERVAALSVQLADATKERDELRGCTHDLRSTMTLQAKQLEQEMAKAVQERDEQAKKAASAERRAEHSLTEVDKSQQSEAKHRQELRRAEGLLRSLNDERCSAVSPQNLFICYIPASVGEAEVL